MHLDQVHSRQEQKFALVFGAAQDSGRTGLTHTLQQQTHRHLRVVAKMPLEKPFVLAQLFDTGGPIFMHVGEPVDQQHRIAMGQVVEDFSSLH